ncbi:MBL fold metallo-hydrolase [Staphylococcus caeli]|uniref:MBL fold metallo-hydrolase n=1 Tax=Staphylococcus caeli TaxID=2201815 RepID=UPI003F55C81C
MQFTQISSHIFKLSIEMTVGVPILINTWYVVKDNKVYIIDTGMASYADLQIKAARSLGEPHAIFLTHGHLDHIDGAQIISETLDIPIFAHENELPFINGELPYPNKNVVEKTKVSQKVLPFECADTVPLEYFLTPGHAPGHVVFFHKQDKVLICGDLFISDSEHLHPPVYQFTYDMIENIDSGQIIDDICPTLITTSHGHDLNYSKDIYPIYNFKYKEQSQ